MAEGPLVHHYARQLRKVLKAKKVRIEFGTRELKRAEASVKGVRVRDVEAYGKQFRIKLSNGSTVLVHLMMWGDWRIFKRGEPWGRPPERARAVFRTGMHEVVAFSAPVVRLLTEEELGEDSKWGSLGPDPLRKDFSSREFWRRLRKQPDREIGEAIHDQRVISGVGNILRIEILFGSRLHPRRLVGDLSQADRRRLLNWILRLMNRWLKDKKRGADDGKWIRIYRRSSKPCPRCGGKIESFRQGGRITFACKDCQT
jgi:endonuclease-8